MPEQTEDFKRLIDPWIDPRPVILRDAKQTFICKGLPIEGQSPSREYGFPVSHLSLADLTALARTGVTLIIHYEEGLRTQLKPIPTLEVIKNAVTPKVGTTKSKEIIST